MFEWLALNKLSLNISKTKYMIFHNRQKNIGPNLPNLQSLLMLIATMTRGGRQAAPSPVRVAEEVPPAASPKRAAPLGMTGIPTAVVSAAAFQVMNGGVLVLSQINRLLVGLSRARAPRAPRDATTKMSTRAH